MGKRGKNKPDHTGRNSHKRYVRIDHELMDTPAFRSLSPVARCLLLELTRRHNASNNGSLWLSVRDAAALVGVSDLKAATRAFDELRGVGFIVMTADAHFSVKASDTARARCWRLTFEAVPAISKPATHDYRNAVVPVGSAERRCRSGLAAVARWKNDINKNRMPVVDSSTMKASFEGGVVLAVVDSSTALTGKCASPVPVVVEDSSTHTVTSGRGSLSCWWTNPVERRAMLWAHIVNHNVNGGLDGLRAAA